MKIGVVMKIIVTIFLLFCLLPTAAIGEEIDLAKAQAELQQMKKEVSEAEARRQNANEKATMVSTQTIEVCRAILVTYGELDKANTAAGRAEAELKKVTATAKQVSATVKGSSLDEIRSGLGENVDQDKRREALVNLCKKILNKASVRPEATPAK